MFEIIEANLIEENLSNSICRDSSQMYSILYARGETQIRKLKKAATPASELQGSWAPAPLSALYQLWLPSSAWLRRQPPQSTAFHRELFENLFFYISTSFDLATLTYATTACPVPTRSLQPGSLRTALPPMLHSV